MQTIIIKSNRLRDSPFADIIWMGFNNAVRDSFSRLSLPRRMYPWTLRLTRGQGRFGEPADAIPRFGERHPVAMHRATFTTNGHDREHRLFRVRVLLLASSWYHSFLYFSPFFRFHSFILRNV